MGAAEPGVPGQVSTCQAVAPVFTGRGSEYFRIWVVNLLLTLLTLGIYSAWAKARRARYLRQNTRLDGHVFDYHGRPVAILRGRLLAAVLLAAYTWMFQFSNTAGVVTVGLLCALGPWLLMRAQQFALANTSYRGLRFGFDARTGDAYRTLLPVLVLWLAPTVATVLTRLDLWALGATLLGWPWMHHRMKRYQRSHATYGDSRFSFTSTLGRFYWVYLKGTGYVVAGTVCAMVVLMLAAAVWHGSLDRIAPPSTLETWIYGGLIGLIVYLAAGPYYSARLQQIVWDRTRLGAIQFRTEIRAWPLFRLVVKNSALTLVTAGLYWPFGAMAVARYRIECVRVESEMPLSALAGTVRAGVVSAAGEGAADAFGVDIGL
jgi:uncharacterized membrane protein YjgN (DUF898 family)